MPVDLFATGPKDLFEDSVETPHRDKRYQQYLDDVRQRQTRASIPGAEAYDKAPALPYEEWSAQREKDNRNKVIGTGEAALSFLTGIPATFIGGLSAITAPINPFAHTKDLSKNFEDISSLLTYTPRTDEGQAYARDIGHVMQAFPAVGGYVHMPVVKAPKAKVPSVLERLPQREQPTLERPVPQQLELPLETSAQSIAEMQARGTQQMDLFASDTANREVGGRLGNVEVGAGAQRAIEDRQRALEFEVARQAGLDRNAAERIRQEQAPTGYSQWQAEQAVREAQQTHDFLSRAKQDVIDDHPHSDPGAQYGSTLEHGRVDENGIPIRADLSMEAQQLQNPLQRNLWGDELPGRTGDNGLPMTRALDKMPPGPEREAALAQLSGIPEKALADKVSTILNEGMAGLSRTQRGAIDVAIFDPNYYKEKMLPNGIKLVFKGGGEPTVAAFQNDQRVAHATFSRDQHWRETLPTQNLEAKWIQTLPEYQKQGLAKELYTFVKELGNDVVPSDIQTPYGKKMWESFDRQGLTDKAGPQWRRDTRRFVPSGQRGALDFGSNSEKARAIEEATKLPLFAKPPTPETVVADALKAGKDAKSIINLSAGGTLEAAKRNSPLVQGAVRIVQSMKNQAEYAIRSTVFPAEKALRALPKQEIIDLGEVFKKEMFERQPYSMKELADAGMSEKQLLAYSKVREMFNAALEAQNKARAIKGQEPISGKEFYLSSRWQGDFRIPFHDAKGRLAWYIAADNKWSAERQASKLLAQFPELTPGEMQTVKHSKRGGATDVQSVYSLMLDVLGRDDPAVAKIKDWAENQLVEDVSRVKGQEKHFEPKANIRGFVGDRVWNDPLKETLEMFQQQIQYAKNAHTWSKLQEAGQSIKEIISNKDLELQQPNNMAYVREYFADQLGANEYAWVKGIENSIRNVGMSPNQLGRGIGNVKSIWVGQKLAANLGFAASNLIQAGNMLPHLTDIMHKYGGNPVSALLTGVPLGIAMATGHLGQTGPKFYQMLGKIPGYDEFTAKAMKYAEDNSVIARSIYDESPIESSFSKTAMIGKAAGKTITLPETFLRGVTYMTYVEQLRSSGKFKGRDLELFREAEERVNMSMSDYREGERAPIFNKMGNVGNAMNVLQTYPLNYYNQWNWAVREGRRGNVAPALVMFGVQAYAAGAMGIPGFADADKLVEGFKDWLAENNPQAWNKVKNFSLKQLVLDVGGESGLYGGLSTQTGVSMTSRAAAPSPTEMLASPTAPYTDLAQQAGNVAKAAVDPLNKQKLAQAAMSVAPSGVVGALETGPFRDVTSVQTGDTRTYGKPRDLAERVGQYARTPDEERLRALGLRSQQEAVTRDQNYRATKQAQTAASITRELPNKIYNELRNNNAEKAADFLKLYVELSGQEFTTQQLENQIIQEFTTPDQRMIMKDKLPLETVLVYKRLKETMKKMGYE